MPTVNLPDDPTPEILAAITAGLFAPLSGDRDKQRERVIYRRILRAASTAPTKAVWMVEGSQHLTEPTRTITVHHEEEIGRACTTLLADDFPRVEVRCEMVPA